MNDPLFQVRLVLAGPAADAEPMTLTHTAQDPRDTVQEELHIQRIPLIDQTAVRSASVQRNPKTGSPEIGVVFTDQGRKRFAEITRENIGQRLAIVIDGTLHSAPRIATEISGGRCVLSGPFDSRQAFELAQKINDAVVQ